MAIRTTDSQAARMRVSIGAVFSKPSAFNKWAKNKFDRFTQDIADLIDEELMKFGTAVVEKIKENLMASTPGGNIYQIVDKKGNVLEEWRASAPGQMPAVFTELLLNSIDYQVGCGADRADFVEIGVFSNAQWKYKTIAFHGPDKKHPYGRIVVGEGGTPHPVREYAKVLEGESPEQTAIGDERPFLRTSFKQVLDEQRKDRQRRMKEIFEKRFGEKVNVSFRIYVGKEFQQSK